MVYGNSSCSTDRCWRGFLKNMEQLLPAAVVPSPNFNGCRAESDYSESSRLCLMVGCKVTETSRAAVVP